MLSLNYPCNFFDPDLFFIAEEVEEKFE